jgi:hypothetical protein
MAYVPRFRNDIFVSYSHIDNQSVKGSSGWVSDFHQRLQIEVEEQLGAHITIWRDARIGATDDFSRDIDRQLRDSAVLLAVLSPGYEASAWCEREAKGFLTGVYRVGDLWVDTKCRMIKIAKRPTAMILMPEIGCVDFFDRDQASGRAYELEGGAEQFNRLLTDVGHEIVQVLRTMRQDGTVFLGTASTTLAGQRARLQRELEARNYRVLANSSDDSDEIGTAVMECALTILFDSGHEPAREEVADARARQERNVATSGRARQLVVARRPFYAATTPRPDETVPSPSGGAGADPSSAGDHGPAPQVDWLVDPSPHALYHTVLQMLKTRAETRSGKLVRLYLICDRQDHPLLQFNHARSLRDHLLRLGFEVKTPLAEGGEAAEFSRDNRSKLRQCDAVMIYWGASRQSWFDERLRELVQSLGWRNGRTFTAIGAFVSIPESPIKDNYETIEVDELIKQFGPFDDADPRLTRFVACLALSA